MTTTDSKDGLGHVGDRLTTVARKLTAGVAMTGALFAAGLTFDARPSSAKPEKSPSKLAVLADQEISSLGNRILKIAKGPGRTPSKTNGSRLDGRRMVIDVPGGPPSQVFSDDYNLSVIFSREKSGRIRAQDIRDVYIMEGVEHNNPYVYLSYVQAPNGEWSVVDDYLLSDDPFTTNLPDTERASTVPNLFGVSQPQLTGQQLNAIVGQGNQIVDNALAGQPTGLMPPAF